MDTTKYCKRLFEIAVENFTLNIKLFILYLYAFLVTQVKLEGILRVSWSESILVNVLMLEPQEIFDGIFLINGLPSTICRCSSECFIP